MPSTEIRLSRRYFESPIIIIRRHPHNARTVVHHQPNLSTNPTLPVGTVGRGHYSDGLSGDIANGRHSAIGDLPNAALAVLAFGRMGLGAEQNCGTDYHSTHSRILLGFQRHERTRYQRPLPPWALASPVRLMLPLGVQVLQLGDEP
jgi:hypothetical protein